MDNIETSELMPARSHDGASEVRNDHYIICIGASAGGMEAIHELFDCMPEDTGFSFIVIQHLSSNHKSLMAELLSKHTAMKVVEAKDKTHVAPNTVYVIPNNRNITICDRRLSLSGREKGRSPNMAIDIFLGSLANDVGEKAIAIILSGTGTDGTKGIGEIKKAGGLVFVQDPSTAKFDGMPYSAISSGKIDFILSPESIAEELLTQHKIAPPSVIIDSLPAEDEPVLINILDFLKSKTSCDFKFYKRPTLIRRLTRRMALLGCENLADYSKLLQRNGEEANLLSKEFLIGVTHFFRDPEAFQELKLKVIPEIVRAKSHSDTIKIWVAGCSTGEEVYSIAMLMREHLNRLETDLDVKIFASDVNKDSIDFASKGCYPESVATDMPAELLEKYFAKEANKYRVVTHLRKMIVFSRHDLLKDPPFGRLDLVCCRNMLIYIAPEVQRRIMAIFNFSLNVGGYMFLGPSENIRDLKDSMLEISKKWRIYKKAKAGKSIGLDSVPYVGTHEKKDFDHSPYVSKELSRKAMTEMLLSSVSEECFLAGAMVDRNCNIIETFGDYKKYLTLPDRKFDNNLLKMLPPKISIIIGSRFRNAITKNEKQVVKNLRITEQDTLVTVTVKPLQRSDNQLALVLFNGATKGRVKGRVRNIDRESKEQQEADESTPNFSDFLTLQSELKETKEILQRALEDAETTNEELQSSNEELISANEELQSTNEELQSLNEELHTVNAENQMRIRQISELNDDLNNYFASTDIGQVFLDKDLTIRKYTPQATAIINLIDSDIGRPISHISNNISYKDFLTDIREVLNKATAVVKIIPVINSGWFQMKVFPYLRQGKDIDGVVLTFVDVTAIKIAEKKLQKANRDLKELNTNLLRSNQELEQFAYITSHDLQEPLRKIQTFVELIGKANVDPLALNKYLEKIGNCAARMSLLINDVLNYARLIKADQGFVETDLNDVLKTVMTDLELVIEQKGARILSPNLPVVSGMPLQLQQLFSNLISNSIKFCEQSPVIKITYEMISREDVARIERLNEEAGYVKLTFKDNGIGFDQQYASRIFTIFQRLNHKDSYSGTGIGLAFCKRIVENHHGVILASSKVDGGSTFEVYLPLRSEH
jgi:two-component system, chemotaxis family, CheB/CheR fusion protein